jgi:hypothetical protein
MYVYEYTYAFFFFSFESPANVSVHVCADFCSKEKTSDMDLTLFLGSCVQYQHTHMYDYSRIVPPRAGTLFLTHVYILTQTHYFWLMCAIPTHTHTYTLHRHVKLFTNRASLGRHIIFDSCVHTHTKAHYCVQYSHRHIHITQTGTIIHKSCLPGPTHYFLLMCTYSHKSTLLCTIFTQTHTHYTDRYDYSQIVPPWTDTLLLAQKYVCTPYFWLMCTILTHIYTLLRTQVRLFTNRASLGGHSAFGSEGAAWKDN